MPLSDKAKTRIAFLVHSIQCSYAVEGSSNPKVWTQLRFSATVALFEEFGIELPSLPIARVAVEECDALGNRKEVA